MLLHDPRTDQVYEAPVSLRVHPTTDVTETLQRALTRAPVHRFDPVLCTDRHGSVLGLLRILRLDPEREQRLLAAISNGSA